MAQFYADIKSKKGNSRKKGTKISGIEGHIHGWTKGCRVICRFDEKIGMDIISIYKTVGFSAPNDELILEF